MTFRLANDRLIVQDSHLSTQETGEYTPAGLLLNILASVPKAKTRSSSRRYLRRQGTHLPPISKRHDSSTTLHLKSPVCIATVNEELSFEILNQADRVLRVWLATPESAPSVAD